MSEIAAHRRKYARVERERRFLVHALPSDRPAARTVEVVDRYLEGTRLRLRRMTGPAGTEPMHVFKLAQKIPEEGRLGRGLITNTYLSQREYDVLAAVGGSELRKTRYSIPPMGVDVFAPPLDGLILAEAEFETDGEMAEFEPPDYVGAEVTSDVRFTGGKLARATHRQLVALLAEYRA
jgi:CYTH domain-containing protein